MDVQTFAVLTGGIIFCAVTSFAISALHGAASEIGKAGLAESAPWITRFVSRATLRLVLVRRRDLFDDLEPELLSLVEETFRHRQGVTDRVTGIFIVLREVYNLASQGLELRKTRLIQSPPCPQSAPSNPDEIDPSPRLMPQPPAVSPGMVRALTDTSRAYQRLFDSLDTGRLVESVEMMNTRALELLDTAAVQQKLLNTLNTRHLAESMETMNTRMLDAMESFNRRLEGWR